MRLLQSNLSRSHNDFLSPSRSFLLFLSLISFRRLSDQLVLLLCIFHSGCMCSYRLTKQYGKITDSFFKWANERNERKKRKNPFVYSVVFGVAVYAEHIRNCIHRRYELWQQSTNENSHTEWNNHPYEMVNRQRRRRSLCTTEYFDIESQLIRSDREASQKWICFE